jgi:DNA-binding transcriptional LysR family regulator
MNIVALEHFLAVAYCGSFTVAANRSCISQQGFSKSIKTLEASLGVTLFSREGKRVVPTEAGRALVSIAQRMVDDYQLLLREAGTWHSRRESVARERKPVLFASPLITINIWELLKRRPRSAALNEVMLIETEPGDFLARSNEELAQALMLTCLDAAGEKQLRQQERFVFEPLFSLQLSIRASRSLLSPRKKQVTIQELSRLPIVCANDAQLLRQIAGLGLSINDLNIVSIFSNSVAIDEFVARGEAVAFSDSLTAFLRQDSTDQLYLPVKGAKLANIGFVHLAQGTLDSRLRAFYKDFLSFFKSSCHYYLRRFAPVQRESSQ